MPNENCLEGIKCPHCGNEDRFLIVATILADVTDDGADTASRSEWDWNDASHTHCPNCGKSGPLTQFSVDNGDAPQTIKADANLRVMLAAPKLLGALRDLLGDLPSVQGGQCHHCGREYHDIPNGNCPSDDCPSFNARAAIAEATGNSPPEPIQPIVIEVRGGVVQDVQNVPPGYDYEIMDYDNIEADEEAASGSQA